MTKTKITEVTEKFDEKGRVVERITRTEESNDDTVYYPYSSSILRAEPIKTINTYKKDDFTCTVSPAVIKGECNG